MPSKTLATDTLNGAIVTAPAVGTSEVWTVTTTPSDTATATGLGATAPYDVIVDNEIVHVTAVNVGAKQLTLTRGYGGTTPATHVTGATLTHIVTGEYLNAADVRLNAPLAHAHAEGDVTSLTADLGTLTSGVAANTAAVALRAPIASPALTGIPTAPTAAGGTNTTQLATTAFVLANAGGGGAGRTTFSNANYTILSTDKYVAQIGTLSAPRTATLPAANAVAAGYIMYLADESNTVSGTNTITIARAGADTINGGTSFVLAQPFKIVRLISDGTSKWTADLIFQPTIVDFTANGTSVIPAGCQTVTLIAVSGGGGGGSARRGAAATVRAGGGGGGGGGVGFAIYNAADLGGPGTTLTVTIGAGGIGAAAIAVDDTNGAAGSDGSATQVVVGSFPIVFAARGRQGGGGTTAGGSAGDSNAVGLQASFPFYPGAAGGASGAGNGPVTTQPAGQAPGGGGGGGGISAANANFAGGGGAFGSQAWGNNANAPGAAGSTGGGNGGNGTLVRTGSPGGGGGGGGGSNAAGAGGTGGNGIRGSGGGGGGASVNGSNSGAGGNGGDGWARIIYQ